jgi:hypothetical protein
MDGWMMNFVAHYCTTHFGENVRGHPHFPLGWVGFPFSPPKSRVTLNIKEGSLFVFVLHWGSP